ncbi:MAG: hypothetical protein ACRDZ2_12510 [Ilumatobacteraceae bacterium]
MHRLLKLAAGSFLLAVAGCGLGSANFKDSAESTIEDDDRMGENFGGVTFDDAECEDPANDDVDTTFTCTATASDGTPANFLITITSEDEFLIDSDFVSGAASTTAATTVPGSPPTS